MEHRDPMTLTRQIMLDQSRYPAAGGNFTQLLSSIQLACKVIGTAVRKAGLYNLYGSAGGETNASGDHQKKLDVLSNDIFVNAMRFCDQVAIMASEENEGPIFVDPEHMGKYIVCFDPLDGSSNIDANVSVGTIFGIYACSGDPRHMTPEQLRADILQPGTNLCAAGYALYGSSLMIVLSTNAQAGVRAYTYDPTIGEFILTMENMRIPPAGAIYSINEGNAGVWDAATTEYVHQCKFPLPGGKKKSLRYIGSMVADVHRTLLYGGIFLYPGDRSAPEGKLRLMYECAPMAFLLEAAGGSATTGRRRILDIVPTGIHMRVPIIMGSRDDVATIVALYEKHDTSAPAAAAKA